MKQLVVTIALLFGICLSANADVWKWVDALGKTHFVDTMKPIYTWVDEFGKIHYSDTPDHEDAVSVQLVWLSTGTLDEVSETKDKPEPGGYAYPGETAEDRAEREKAEAYYCKRATEIYDSYLNAPQLYRTGEDGEREYLSKKDAAATIAETKAKMNELCD
jgi:Zn-finger nucleic acid-binding protein